MFPIVISEESFAEKMRVSKPCNYTVNQRDAFGKTESSAAASPVSRYGKAPARSRGKNLLQKRLQGIFPWMLSGDKTAKRNWKIS
jgi:hypothetical protein